jgi:hypothetical protein
MTYFMVLAIGAGFALGYIFALDVTGWYFVKPSTLLLMEITGAIVLYRITIGMMEDDEVSAPVKRGFIWAIFGLFLAHVLNLSYLYLKDLQASFNIQNVDFSETLAISWVYMHFTMIGFVLGALTEYGSAGIRKNRIRRKLKREKRLFEKEKKRELEKVEPEVIPDEIVVEPGDEPIPQA